MDAVVEYGSYVVDVIESSMYSASEHTGLRWGPMTPQQYWFRRPIVHVIEFFLYNAFVALCFYLSRGYYRSIISEKTTKFHRCTNSRFDRFLGLMFVLCLILQVLIKALRTMPFVQLCWLIMPCHLHSMLWGYIFFVPKSTITVRNRCAYLASAMLAWHWGPIGAAAFPDFRDHQTYYERYVFVIQHALLVLVPYYYAARYALVPMTKKFFCHITAIATFVNVDPYMIVSYISGLNINYMLCPPPKLDKFYIFNTQWYRGLVILTLIVLAVSFRVSGEIFVAAGNFVRRLAANRRGKKTA